MLTKIYYYKKEKKKKKRLSATEVVDTNLCSIILREQFTKTANPNRENDGGIAKICHFLFHDRVQKFVYMTFFILGSFNFFF